MMNSTKQIALFVVLGTCGCGGGSDDASRHEQNTAPSLGESEAIELAFKKSPSIARDNAHLVLSDKDSAAWISPVFIQRYKGVNFNSLIVTDFARVQDGTWESVSYQHSATFSAMQFASGGVDSYALLGVTRSDDIVVEVWSLVASDGSVVTYSEVGGIPSGSLIPKKFVTKRLFRGASGHTPIGIELDPSGRFVVYALRDTQGVTTLYQLNSEDSSATPQALSSSISIPEVSDVAYVQKFEHAVLGRVYVFGSLKDYVRLRVVFIDSDDNAVFDGPPMVGGDAYFDGLGLGQYENWRPLNR